MPPHPAPLPRRRAATGIACALSAGAALLCSLAPALRAQTVPRFEIAPSPIQLEGPARPGVYLGAVGRRAALLGEETGAFEAWAWPLLLLRDFELGFEIPDYDAPIPGASVARRVIVRPELATVVYSHASFTVCQHLLVPLDEPGAVILLEVDAVTPLEIVASFRADLDLMWPAALGGQSARWDAENRRFVLSESLRRANAFVGSPAATGGTSHPAHAAPDAPSVMRIAVDPERAGAEMIPIVLAGGLASREALGELYDRLLATAPRAYAERVAHAARLRDGLAAVHTPEPTLDLALEWAKVNLDEARACNDDLGCGLVAGYGPSGRGRRPGFGWFFGGDASMNALGIAPTGDFETVRAALDFQGRNRREDGKMPHEVTQSARRTGADWFRDYPYAYYHADTTPHWLIALWRYWLQSGDLDFVRAQWDAVADAWSWTLANDSDGDLIVDNTSAGLGAVEVGGIGAGLHQDVYLAGVSVESLRAIGDLAEAIGERELAARARERFATARAGLERQYWLEPEGRYAFGVLEGGRTNPAATVWPAIPLAFGLLDGARAGRDAGALDLLASPRLLSDWGARMLDADHPLYDPLQYNMGTVWGFVTGFSGWALFRHDRPHAGFAALWSSARSTFHNALGRHPELLSGAYHRTLDTTVPHQFFATSAIPLALFRGLLGLDADAPRQRLGFSPYLPADWDRLEVTRYPVGEDRVDVGLTRRSETGSDGRPVAVLAAHLERRGDGGPLEVSFAPRLPPCSRLVEARIDGRAADAGPPERGVTVRLERSALVELRYRPGFDLVPRRPSPAEGEPTTELHVVDYRCQPGERAAGDAAAASDRYVLTVAGRSGRREAVELTGASGSPRELRGAELEASRDGRTKLLVDFDGTGELDATGFETREIGFAGPPG
jgi:glycogen debranching enzyme